MRYDNIRAGVFLSRPNRFIAHVDVDGRAEVCHVKNTGRCRELLVPGAAVWLTESANSARKTRYDLVAVQKGERLINMDAAAPNRVFGEYLAAGLLLPSPTLIRPETRFGDSRLDFYVENRESRAFCEVKGVTLERDGAALFPDAPTERGVRHLGELARCVEAGFSAWAVFVIQMEGVDYFAPNRETHPAFADALRAARDAGVHLLALDCRVTPDSLTARKQVEIRL